MSEQLPKVEAVQGFRYKGRFFEKEADANIAKLEDYIGKTISEGQEDVNLPRAMANFIAQHRDEIERILDGDQPKEGPRS